MIPRVETEQTLEDMVKLICLFMCILFFTTKDAHKLKEKYIGLVDNLEKSNNVSRTDLIHSFLDKKINQNYNTPEDITSYVVYLLLLYAEHTHLVKPLKLPDDRYLPRAARWNIKEISVKFLKDMETSQYTISPQEKQYILLG
ncbi:hypothetical protein MKW98_011474 [Papaver atlanticum]|uniref:Uncharacterized protein n=1 Tax=Papaver atlanticum TaxID=357466 RepID=A0AAD4X417_9MAGN|nr:hypothetical protein MKW98_011474 [Papaver atlanticum]